METIPGGSPAAPGDSPEALRARVDALEAEVRRVSDDYVAAVAQVTSLAALSSALGRIHASLCREEILEAVAEVVVNLVGSEDFALYEWHDDAAELRLATSFGPARAATCAPGRGPAGQVAASRTALLGGDEGPVACVPLEAGDRLVGVLCVDRLLAHRPPFGPEDGELLDVLARHAAAALYLSALHRAAGGRA